MKEKKIKMGKILRTMGTAVATVAIAYVIWVLPGKLANKNLDDVFK